MKSMRTPVRLDASLLAEVEQYAADTGQTLAAVIETALRELLAHRLNALKPAKVRLPTLPGGDLQPEIDLDDTSALLDLMEDRNG